MNFEEIIKMTKDAAEKHLINVSGDKILEVSQKIYVSQNISLDNKSKSSESYQEGKPSQRQMDFLKTKNYVIPSDMSFEEAKKIIGEIIDKEKAQKKKEVEY